MKSDAMTSTSAVAEALRTRDVTVTSLVDNVINAEMSAKSVSEDAVSNLESVASAEESPDIVLCLSNSSDEISEDEDQREKPGELAVKGLFGTGLQKDQFSPKQVKYLLYPGNRFFQTLFSFSTFLKNCTMQLSFCFRFVCLFPTQPPTVTEVIAMTLDLLSLLLLLSYFTSMRLLLTRR